MIGKPVVMTAWSGSMTYATPTSACLVPATLCTPDGTDAMQFDAFFLGKRASWADPSIPAAAYWMARIKRDTLFRESVAKEGQDKIHEHVARAFKCEFVTDLSRALELKLGCQSLVPTLACSKSRIKRARRVHAGLVIQHIQRKLSGILPGYWRLRRWIYLRSCRWRT